MTDKHAVRLHKFTDNMLNIQVEFSCTTAKKCPSQHFTVKT